MPPYPVKLSAFEVVLWLLECGLLVYALSRRRRITQDQSTSALACAFAILLAWNWRLIYEFALGSSGFWYLVADDPGRWTMSYGWSRDPYFLTWDGIWQGGTFYLHGSAMRLLHDPMMASKLVSAFYSLLPLIGLFVLSQGLYRSRKFSLFVVLFAAPLWLHVLLSTGSLAEMPVVGLMLTGVGLMLLSIDRLGQQRIRFEFSAALSLAAATAFHVTAWMMLIPLLLIWLGYSVRNRKNDPAAIKRWFLFAIVSSSYCVAWIVGCWLKFGEPLKMFKDYAAHVIRDLGGQLPLRDRVLAYPSAIAYTLWGVFPLVMVGLFLGLFRDEEEKQRVRWVVIGGVVTLLLMMESAIRADPNAHAYRSTVTLATLLIPIALAPLWPMLQELLQSLRQRTVTLSAKMAIVGMGLLILCWLGDNHQRTLREQRELDSMYSDSVGVGSWLRQEIIRPQLLDLTPTSPPVRLWNPEPPMFGNMSIMYAAGNPGRVQIWEDANPGLDSLQPGQYLISNRKLDDPRLAKQWEFGHYVVYRFGK